MHNNQMGQIIATNLSLIRHIPCSRKSSPRTSRKAKKRVHKTDVQIRLWKTPFITNTIFAKYRPPTLEHNTLSLHFHYIQQFNTVSKALMFRHSGKSTVIFAAPPCECLVPRLHTVATVHCKACEITAQVFVTNLFKTTTHPSSLHESHLV